MAQETFRLLSAAVSDRGLSEKRPQNEDSYLEVPERGLFAVADGVGGAQAGDVASQMAVEILSEAFANLRPNEDAEQRMKVAIEHANSVIYQTSRDLPQLATMASTIVALHINGNIATIGHVGDSRLYRLNVLGQIYRETNDHSVVEEEVRAGRMSPAQAANHPSRNIISRAVGAEASVDVEMKTIMIDSNTTFLLCSDGITRHLEDHELRDYLNKYKNPVEACAILKEICYKRGAEDNLTAVIVKVGYEASELAPLNDFEETTIAAARTAAVAAPHTAQQQIQTLDEQEDSEFESDFAARTAPSVPAIPARTDEDFFNETQEFSVPAAEPHNDPAVQSVMPLDRDEKTYRIDQKSSGGFLTSLIKGAMMILLGAFIGGIIYHFFFNPTVMAPPAETAPPQISRMQTPDIEYSAFENNRRNVDRNPELFIGSSNGTAQTAEDYYLLGRAYFLTNRYPEAARAFAKAKQLIGDTREVNRKTLENDIAVGISIAENSIARTEFLTQKKSLGATTAGNANTANANTNTAP